MLENGHITNGEWTPAVNMGGAGTGGNHALNLTDLLAAAAAKQLGVDMSVKGAAQTKK